jgi:hypothetical protein
VPSQHSLFPDIREMPNLIPRNTRCIPVYAPDRSGAPFLISKLPPRIQQAALTRKKSRLKTPFSRILRQPFHQRFIDRSELELQLKREGEHV